MPAAGSRSARPVVGEGRDNHGLDARTFSTARASSGMNAVRSESAAPSRSRIFRTASRPPSDASVTVGHAVRAASTAQSCVCCVALRAFATRTKNDRVSSVSTPSRPASTQKSSAPHVVTSAESMWFWRAAVTTATPPPPTMASAIAALAVASVQRAETEFSTTFGRRAWRRNAESSTSTASVSASARTLSSFNDARFAIATATTAMTSASSGKSCAPTRIASIPPAAAMLVWFGL
eukprot:Amastigsp_a681157_8.p1 type:complete len:236 gc:universal Amastigsp_a681157_8:25-732(+)